MLKMVKRDIATEKKCESESRNQLLVTFQLNYVHYAISFKYGKMTTLVV